MAGEHVFTDDGVRLWFEAEGAGVPLVLCHGGPGLWDNLSGLAALLTDTARVIRWEQRGCGRSDRRGPYTVDRYVTDLDQLREHLGYERWVVGGHSWGATFALRYALGKPARVAGLICISSTGIGQAWKSAYHAEADRRLTAEQRCRRDELRLVNRSKDEEREYRILCWAPDFADRSRAHDLARLEASAPFETNYECNAALNAETREWDEEAGPHPYRRLQAPTLILHGAADPRPTWAVESLSAALPRAELHVLSSAGHLPWVETSGGTAGLLKAFLRDIVDDL